MKAMASEPANRRRLGSRMILLLGVGGLLLSLLLAGVVGSWRAAQAVQAELARIRAAGEPASAEELESLYTAPPADRDTTQLWLAATAVLDTPKHKADAEELPLVGMSDDPIPWPGDPWPKLKAAQELLSDYRESLLLVHRAAELGGQAHFAIDFSNGIAIASPHNGAVRAAARLLSLESVVLAHGGQTDAAIDSALAIFAVARSHEDEPTLIAQLSRMAISGLAVNRVEWLLTAKTLNEDQLARIEVELSSLDYQRDLRLALLSERALTMEVFADPSSVAEYVPAGLTPYSDQAVYLQLMAEMLAVTRRPAVSRHRAVDRVFDHVEQLKGAFWSSRRFPLTLLFLPSRQQSNAADRSEARRDSAHVALAIERYSLRHGRLPNNLDALVPEFMDCVPIDPFNGAPLRYRVDAKEYVVYSVGADGMDQGGDTSPPEDQPVDLVFRVRRKDVGQEADSPTVEPQR